MIRAIVIAALLASGCQRVLCRLEGGHVIDVSETVIFGAQRPVQICVVNARRWWRL